VRFLAHLPQRRVIHLCCTHASSWRQACTCTLAYLMRRKPHGGGGSLAAWLAANAFGVANDDGEEGGLRGGVAVTAALVISAPLRMATPVGWEQRLTPLAYVALKPSSRLNLHILQLAHLLSQLRLPTHAWAQPRACLHLACSPAFLPPRPPDRSLYRWAWLPSYTAAERREGVTLPQQAASRASPHPLAPALHSCSPTNLYLFDGDVAGDGEAAFTTPLFATLPPLSSPRLP